MPKVHSFHIPVMGIAFTIDTPIKVAHLGIDSVISLVDDILLEKLRKLYCSNFDIPYEEISEKTHDFRAKRISSYLNLINLIVDKKLDELKNTTQEKLNELKEYFNLLPSTSEIKQEFLKLTARNINIDEIKNWAHRNLYKGSIDVNIMTKLDKDNYSKGKKLSTEYNDAHAALRGFANSNLNASVVLSAGMNPRLYSYMENFEDFYPNEKGELKKKIILKVSDYRSALIQGRFFAKKGLWVSEYRIESGLNCGGHAFATDGFLFGPILAEFKENREKLNQLANEVLRKGLQQKNKIVPKENMQFLITAQGGVGTSEEHQFLLNHYQIDSVGWGSPFLLVPEAVTIDKHTLKLLENCKEEDLYLSNISPLGVPFNNLRRNTKDLEKLSLATNGQLGSSCPKKYVATNNEFTEKYICPASKNYQKRKLKSLTEENLSSQEFDIKYNKMIEKSCICVGLGTPALLVNNLNTKAEGPGVSVCPGPNLAYFSKEMSLKQMVDHIYGLSNQIGRKDRPNMFIKELGLYVDYIKNLFLDKPKENNTNDKKNLEAFIHNLNNGIQYYEGLFTELKDTFKENTTQIFTDLELYKKDLNLLYLRLQ